MWYNIFLDFETDFDAVSGSDDPTVGEKSSSTFVLELTPLVLAQ